MEKQPLEVSQKEALLVFHDHCRDCFAAESFSHAPKVRTFQLKLGSLS